MLELIENAACLSPVKHKSLTVSMTTPTNQPITVHRLQAPNGGQTDSMTAICPGAPRKRFSVDHFDVSSEARMKLDFSTVN